MQATGQPYRSIVVAILSLAWLLASNHCAIASLTGGHAKDEHSCCAKDKPVKSSSCAESCCDKMAAPLKAADTLFAPGLAMIAILAEFLPQIPVPADAVGSSGLSPPGSGFFVSFVLGCSQYSLAPPVFVA